MDKDSLEKRQAIALRAIKSLYGKPDGEYGPTLFVSHHLTEIEPDYWRRMTGVERPSPEEILDLLAPVDAWSSEGDENIDTFDFGLPDDVSNYLLSVRLGDDGEVQDVSMES